MEDADWIKIVLTFFNNVNCATLGIRECEPWDLLFTGVMRWTRFIGHHWSLIYSTESLTTLVLCFHIYTHHQRFQRSMVYSRSLKCPLYSNILGQSDLRSDLLIFLAIQSKIWVTFGNLTCILWPHGAQPFLHWWNIFFTRNDVYVKITI